MYDIAHFLDVIRISDIVVLIVFAPISYFLWWQRVSNEKDFEIDVIHMNQNIRRCVISEIKRNYSKYDASRWDAEEYIINFIPPEYKWYWYV